MQFFARWMTVLAVLAPLSAAAQTTIIQQSPSARALADVRDAAVRVQVSINLTIAGMADDASAEADKRREDARRRVYELADKECALLLQVLAKECRLENVNVNLSQQANPRGEGLAVRANMAYRITPK